MTDENELLKKYYEENRERLRLPHTDVFESLPQAYANDLRKSSGFAVYKFSIAFTQFMESLILIFKKK